MLLFIGVIVRVFYVTAVKLTLQLNEKTLRLVKDNFCDKPINSHRITIRVD